ncbi:MAG: amidohydrolase family protein [Lachnospiraceae bacterium]|nr:amidohydrolase family protein [Lachnospiraceae bacterium]
MELKKFHPVSEAVVPVTDCPRPRFPVIDFHTHCGKMLLGENYASSYDTEDYVRRLLEYGVVKAVNLDGFYGNDLDEMNRKIAGFEQMFVNFMWVDMERFGEPDFPDRARRQIRECYRNGCCGIKMWKDLTLYRKDSSGKPIRTDDPRLNVIYETAAELGIPVLMHIGDPVAFFKPKDERNERYEELSANPDWEFSDRSRFLSFEELMEMQENTVRRHPGTTFVIAHVGSYAENLGWVGEQLSKYPNLYVDIAARLAELGRVPYSARRFFAAYQDRILFGTDSTPATLGAHPTYYRCLETEDEYFSYEPEGEIPGQGRWAIYGLFLEDEVLKKVYYKNACRLLHLDAEAFEEEFYE